MGDRLSHPILILCELREGTERRYFRERQKRFYERLIRDQNLVDEETNSTGTTENTKRSDNIPRNKL
jgi:hypothetical protein